MHNDFYVCNMLLGMQYLCGNESIKNSTNANISIKASSSNGVSNERFEIKRNNQQWFQPQSNNLCVKNKSNRSEVTLTSIELDILKISEKIDNITNAKLASLHMAIKKCGHCGRMSSLHQCCQNSQNPSTPMIESIQIQQFQFAGPSSGSGIPESSYNLHGGVETITGIRQNGISTIRNRNNLRKFRAHRIMGSSQLPLDRCAKSRNIISSLISVITCCRAAAVPFWP